MRAWSVFRAGVSLLAVLSFFASVGWTFHGVLGGRTAAAAGGAVVASLLFGAILGVYLWSELRGDGFGFIAWRTPPLATVPHSGVSLWAYLSPCTPGYGNVWHVWINPAGIRAFVFLLGDTDIPAERIQRAYLDSDFETFCVIEHDRPGFATPIFTSPTIYDALYGVLPEKCVGRRAG